MSTLLSKTYKKVFIVSAVALLYFFPFMTTLSKESRIFKISWNVFSDSQQICVVNFQALSFDGHPLENEQNVVESKFIEFSQKNKLRHFRERTPRYEAAHFWTKGYPLRSREEILSVTSDICREAKGHYKLALDFRCGIGEAWLDELSSGDICELKND